MNKLDVLGKKNVFASPTTKTITNTIVDAVDSAISSTDIYAHAYTATLQDSWDEVNLRSTATDLDLTAQFRYAFGLFLPATLNGNPSGNMLYHCRAGLVANFVARHTLRMYWVFCRRTGSTITQSDAAASNLLPSYILVHEVCQSAVQFVPSQVVAYNRYVDQEVLLVEESDNNPVFFGLVIENHHATTAYNIDMLSVSFQFRRNNVTIDSFRPSGV